MPHRSRIHCPALLITTLALTPASVAGPPMITDDPGTQPAGTWEENFALTLTRTGQTSAWNTPFVDNNYSPTDDLQLTFQFAPAILDDRNAGPVGGIAPVTLATKYRILRENADALGLSAAVTPAFTFDSGTPGVRHGLGVDGWTLFLPVEINQKLGDHLDVFAEAGYLFVQFGGDRWSYGICADWHPGTGANDLHLLAELHVVSSSAFRFNDVVVNLGAVCPLRDGINLQLSAGRALRDTDESSQLLVFAGLQFLLK